MIFYVNSILTLKITMMKLNQIRSKMSAKLRLVALFLIVNFLLPAITFAQGPGGGGGTPDVPFDEDMNKAFLVMGILFAGFVVYRKLRKKSVTQ